MKSSLKFSKRAVLMAPVDKTSSEEKNFKVLVFHILHFFFSIFRPLCEVCKIISQDLFFMIAAQHHSNDLLVFSTNSWLTSSMIKDFDIILSEKYPIYGTDSMHTAAIAHQIYQTFNFLILLKFYIFVTIEINNKTDGSNVSRVLH